MTLSVLLIINPAARKSLSQTNHLLTSCFRLFPAYTLKKTTKRGDAEEFARTATKDILLVAGGDGTINEVINGIMNNKKKKKPSLGIIPLGTSNMVAHAFGIPLSLDKALSLVSSGKRIQIDVGKANTRYFLIGSGIGVDAAMYKNVQPVIKRVFGEIAYPLALVKTILTHDPQQLTVIIGERKVSCYYALVCNIGCFSKLFQIVPYSKPDDGLLDVIIFQSKDIMSQFRYCLGIATKKHTAFHDVQTFSAKKVSIFGKEAMIHCDAELIGKTPVTITCIPKAFSLFVP